MELKELHHFIFTELGVEPHLLYKSESRTDNVVVKYARAIFCRIAKGVGHKTVDIGDYLAREDTTVNNDIRELRAMDWRNDFFSRSVVESYEKVLSLVKEKIR